MCLISLAVALSLLVGVARGVPGGVVMVVVAAVLALRRVPVLGVHLRRVPVGQRRRGHGHVSMRRHAGMV